MNVALLSDLHCGSVVGLTHPHYQSMAHPSARKHLRKAWRWVDDAFFHFTGKYGGIDAFLLGGDLVDGKQRKSGSCGLITADMDTQKDMAEAALNSLGLYANKDCKRAGVFGTDYHVSQDGSEAERCIYERCGFSTYGNRKHVVIDGFSIDLRHKASKSSVPHGGMTPLAKSASWAMLHAERTRTKKADMIVRGHIHEYMFFDHGTLGYAMSLPSLQLAGGSYGEKNCEGYCDFGVVFLRVEGGDLIDLPHRYIMPIQPTAVKPEVLR